MLRISGRQGFFFKLTLEVPDVPKPLRIRGLKALFKGKAAMAMGRHLQSLIPWEVGDIHPASLKVNK